MQQKNISKMFLQIEGVKDILKGQKMLARSVSCEVSEGPLDELPSCKSCETGVRNSKLSRREINTF